MDNIIYTRITSSNSVLLTDVNGTTKPFTGVDIANLKQTLNNVPVDTRSLLLENSIPEPPVVYFEQTQEPERRGPGRPRKF
jgi:hypothetical protein